MNISPLERKRVQNINFIMDDIHDSVSNIYESLIDQEYDQTRQSILILNGKLKTISESINDEF